MVVVSPGDEELRLNLRLSLRRMENKTECGWYECRYLHSLQLGTSTLMPGLWQFIHCLVSFQVASNVDKNSVSNLRCLLMHVLSWDLSARVARQDNVWS